MAAAERQHAAADVRIENVTKRFDAVVAVDDLSLEIARGSFFAMLGPSGCGKTTTLRMIAGFEQPDEGRILLRGEDVTHVPPNRRAVNMVFQHYALFPHMSIAENVALRPQAEEDLAGRAEPADRRDPPGRRAGGAREAQACTAFGRPAAARRPRARPGEPAGRPAPRRAARRTRREAPQANSARAETRADRARHDLRLRDARPGGGDRHVRPIAVMNGGKVEQIGASEGRLRRAAYRVRRRLHRQSRTCSTERRGSTSVRLEGGGEVIVSPAALAGGRGRSRSASAPRRSSSAGARTRTCSRAGSRRSPTSASPRST